MKGKRSLLSLPSLSSPLCRVLFLSLVPGSLSLGLKKQALLNCFQKGKLAQYASKFFKGLFGVGQEEICFFESRKLVLLLSS